MRQFNHQVETVETGFTNAFKPHSRELANMLCLWKSGSKLDKLSKNGNCSLQTKSRKIGLSMKRSMRSIPSFSKLNCQFHRIKAHRLHTGHVQRLMYRKPLVWSSRIIGTISEILSVSDIALLNTAISRCKILTNSTVSRPRSKWTL